MVATQACKNVRTLANIKVPKDTADLLRVYCIFNKRKVSEFATQILEKELSTFRQQLEAMKKIEEK